MSRLSIAAERIQAFVLEPPERPVGLDRDTRAGPAAVPLAVAVVGMSSGCGLTTVASALAAALGLPGTSAVEGDVHGERQVTESRVVWEVPGRALVRTEAVAARADALVSVASGAAEPALAVIVREALVERFGRVILVANRADPARWAGRGVVCFPDSPVAAALARRGRVTPGSFGNATRRLAALVQAR